MGMTGAPPDGTRIVHGTNELFVQQNTIPDGRGRFSCSGAIPAFPFSLPLSRLFDVFRTGEHFITDHRKIFGALNSLPEELYWSWFRDAPTGLGEERRRDLREFDGYPPLTQPLL